MSHSPTRHASRSLISGTTLALALAMAMAGRGVYCADLTGPGVPSLERRCPSA